MPVPSESECPVGLSILNCPLGWDTLYTSSCKGFNFSLLLGVERKYRQDELFLLPTPSGGGHAIRGHRVVIRFNRTPLPPSTPFLSFGMAHFRVGGGAKTMNLIWPHQVSLSAERMEILQSCMKMIALNKCITTSYWSNWHNDLS